MSEEPEGTLKIRIPIRRYWALLRTYLVPQWPYALLLAVLLLSHIGLRLVVPQIMRIFIDTAVAGGELRVLIRAAVLFLGIAVGSQALGILITFYGENVAWRATNALRQDLTLHCLRLDPSFHQAHTPGELISRVDGDVSTLSSFFSRLVVSVAGNAILLAGILILLAVEDWRVGSSMLAFSLIALVVLVRIRALAIPQWKVVREQMAEFYGFVGEQLAGTEDIRANGAAGYALRRFLELVRWRFKPNMRAGLSSYAMWISNETLFGLGTALAYGLAAYLWQREMVTIGSIYLILSYVGLLGGPIAEIRAQLTNLQQAEASIARIEAMLRTQGRLVEPAPGHEVPLPAGPLAVSFDRVHFAYAENEPVLQAVSFTIEPGRVLGLLGHTGSGKTTIARLLLRLYDAEQGQIALSGISPQRATLREVRQRVGMVTQNVELFRASIRDNLTLFNPSISDVRLHRVLDDLGLSEWLAGLPEGLDTELAAGGADLSAGQAQLLAFARVFMGDPGLVILDEASSRLDPATERLIERSVDRLLEGRTAIIIAHRLATVQRADEILILDQGRVVEHGPRAALAGDPGSHFARLLRTGLEGVLA
jgi:ATP-binding cassette subfamily B protein